MANQRLHLLLPLCAVERFRRTLHRIAHAIEFGARPALPQRMQAGWFSLGGERHERFRHDGERAAQSGEAALFGKAAELDGTLPSAWNFINRVRDAGLRDVSLVSRVVK